jgi:poly-gamma-glutamate synthesis protein (capsule biosynthesis protein)
VALVHWGKEDSTVLEDVQIETSKLYIDAGADLIVGSHAHILQGIDFYKGKAIVYNLGDFIFNHETKDTAIFQLKVNDDGSFEYYFIPCRQDDKYTYLLEGNEKLRVLNNIRGLSTNTIIEDSGKFYVG